MRDRVRDVPAPSRMSLTHPRSVLGEAAARQSRRSHGALSRGTPLHAHSGTSTSRVSHPVTS
ncbi:hypothetical protein POSPLADRAFT_1043631 [Postia placenta MAD-698-R-SB12]|uniref:Uncharacterized protein n=1 Tax=Postia placenta MAD-698-R-SB12 TaxID=670580 RepID=A0A1X6NC14_9APHY|nr:hypothetical protein POSPLADRAFT_1043631 [Postia placenta MAD-698-R-SB12]OSX66141.1 hypothetical protein POSPLADRAFT_1043631 [Postia placenta MAD-698-R-SB12]